MIHWTLLSLVLAQSYYTPGEAQALFGQANDAYYREDPATAAGDYRKLLEHGYGGPDVLYNLGTAALAEGSLGEAVLALERARRLSPSADIEANLAFAHAKQADQQLVARAEEPFLERLVGATPLSVTGVIFLIAWSLGFACLVLQRLSRRSSRWLLLTTAAAFVIAIPSGALLSAHGFYREAITSGVVMPKAAPVREFPKDAAKIAFEVHAGLKVRVLEESGSYVRVRLPNGLEGWTEKSAVLEI